MIGGTHKKTCKIYERNAYHIFQTISINWELKIKFFKPKTDYQVTNSTKSVKYVYNIIQLKPVYYK